MFRMLHVNKTHLSWTWTVAFVVFVIPVGSPTPSVNWLKEEALKDVLWIKADTPGYKIASSGFQHSLILMDVEKEHSGTYTCIASNRAGQCVNTARLDVDQGLTAFPAGQQVTVTPE